MTSLVEFFERAYWPRKVKGRSPNTLRLYRNALANLTLFLGRTPTLADLADETAAEWQAWFLSRQRSEETANRNLRHLLALWRFAAKKRIVEQFPTVELLPVKQRTPLAWLRPELFKLFAAAEKYDGLFPGAWWSTLFLLVWFTGERIGAVLRLEWRDYDPSGWLVARAEIRKGGMKDKTFALPRKLCKALNRLPRRGDRIFAWPHRLESIYFHLNKILKSAGLPTDRGSKFHRLRRSTASYLKAAGGDPTEALDHASAQTTKRWYLDSRICGGKTAADLLFDPTK